MNNVPQISTPHLEMKSSDNLEQTPRRSNEGLDPSELECAITRIRDDHFGALFPCLHDFSISGIRSLEGRSCPICRSEVEAYESLEGIDTRIENTKRLLEKMIKVREKVATINRINGEYLVGHADERNDVKAARFNSALREGDLPRLFGDENAIAIPEERITLNRAQLRAVTLNLADQLITTIINPQLKNIKILKLIYLATIIYFVSSSPKTRNLENSLADYLGDFFLKFN